MPLLRVNLTSNGPVLHDTPQPIAQQLRRFRSHPGPAVIMIHGYKYRPGALHHCPHAKIYGTGPDAWPARLPFGTQQGQSGLGVALGWDARGSFRDVYHRAARLSHSLATVINLLRDQAPDRPIHLMSHSLGSELALNALQHLPGDAIGRMILMTGASYAQEAQSLLDTAAGRSAEVLNVTSRENDLFDLAFERLIPAARSRDRAIGQGIGAANVATVQLDCPFTLTHLQRIGFHIAPSRRRICHWSAYTRPGVMNLYGAFLRMRSPLPLEKLADAGPAHPDPRWSRLGFTMACRQFHPAYHLLSTRNFIMRNSPDGTRRKHLC